MLGSVRSMTVWRLWAFATALCALGAAPSIPDRTRVALDRVMGTRGEYIPEESAYRFILPRTDISVRIGPMGLTPRQAPRSWVTFGPSVHHEAIVNGELVLREHEVNPVLSTALNAGLSATGLGVTLASGEPRLLSLSLTGEGRYEALASAFRQALDEVRHVRIGSGHPVAGGAVPPRVVSAIDASQIDEILSMRGVAADGIYRSAVGRVALLGGTPVGREMGIRTTISLLGTSRRAFADAEFAVTGDELQPVLLALRAKDLNIGSIRNHLVGEHPQIVFVRVSGYGAAADLARALRYALDVQVGAVPAPAPAGKLQ